MARRGQKFGPIALDIGSTRVRMLQLADVGGVPSVVAALERQLERRASDGDVALGAVKRCVVDMLGSGGFKGRDVVTALGPNDFQMKNVRLPRMPADDLPEAVMFEAADRFGLDIDDTQIQFMPVGEVRHGNELKEEIIVFAVERQVVERRLELLDSIKLNPVAIDATPACLVRSFVPYLKCNGEDCSINVFLEMGAQGSAIIITRGPEIAFIKLLDIGGNTLTEAVSKALDLPMSEASALRIGLRKGDERKRDAVGTTSDIALTVSDAMRPSLEKIARDLQLCLRYFAVTFRGMRPESVSLLGGEAHEPQLAEVLSSVVDVPCRVGNPLFGVQGLEHFHTREQGIHAASWAVATGLAMRGMPWVAVGDETKKKASSRGLVAALAE